MTQDPNHTKSSIILPLFNKRGEIINGTLVDTEDSAWLSSVNWVTEGSQRSGPYVIKAFEVNYNRLTLSMSVEIMRYHGKYISGLVVDHRNRDTLDNRKANLRMATHAQNLYNSSLQKNNTSGYRGVGVDGQHLSRWMARIRYKRQTFALGTYPTPEEAAIAYNHKATELFGEFANLNEIRSQ